LGIGINDGYRAGSLTLGFDGEVGGDAGFARTALL
jgi:hypothetical protein